MAFEPRRVPFDMAADACALGGSDIRDLLHPRCRNSESSVGEAEGGPAAHANPLVQRLLNTSTAKRLRLTEYEPMHYGHGSPT